MRAFPRPPIQRGQTLTNRRAKSIRRNGGTHDEEICLATQGELPGFAALDAPNNGGAKSPQIRPDRGVEAVKARPEIENKPEDTAIGGRSPLSPPGANGNLRRHLAVARSEISINGPSLGHERGR